MPRFAAITLGSNSFNMLVAEKQGEQLVIAAKYKRKVRLAEGIEADGRLNEWVMERGLDCLSMFAQMLEQENIKSEHVAVIATATLRNISNADEFCQRAFPILGHQIEIISGLREAELIYQGMAATTPGNGRRLVIDIGGASTEFIVGEANKVLFKASLAMGSVTFNKQFFSVFPYQANDFSAAVTEVAKLLFEQRQSLLDLGWQGAVGASGAVQSVLEVLAFRQQPQVITLSVLDGLKLELLASTDISLAGISGVEPERAPTFAAGLAILLGLFKALGIESLVLSGGALREGVLQMVSDKMLRETSDS